MEKYKFILSEYPKDLEGASEWADAEIRKAEKQEKAEQMVQERIKPFIMEAVRRKSQNA